MASAEAVARYVLHLAASGEEPCPITQMQLHKLLYYVQGWNLAHKGEPLFEGRIEAWEHGPVVAELYPRFASFGRAPITETEGRVDSELTDTDREAIEYAWRGYGGYSAPRLRAMTHAEAPWREARADVPGAAGKSEISNESMRRYFREEYEKHCRRWGIDPAELEQSIRDARAGNVTELELPRRGRRDGGLQRAVAG